MTSVFYTFLLKPKVTLNLFVYFLLMALSLNTHSALPSANPLKISTVTDLKANESKTVVLALNEGQYIRGNVSASRSIDVAITQENGVPVRRFSPLPSNNERIHFVAPRAGQYRFNMKAGVNPTTVKLTLDTVPLLPPQKSPKYSAIASPIIQQALEVYQRTRSTESFWLERKRLGTPIIEQSSLSEELSLGNNQQLVTFVWRGAQHGVKLFGAPGHNHDSLYQLEDSDIWFSSYVLPDDTRMSYMLAPDIPTIDGTPREQRVAILATRQQDPFNLNPWLWTDNQDRFSTLSLLELKHAPQPAWTSLTAAKVPLITETIISEVLENQRTLRIYFPEEWQPSDQPTPVAFFFDGGKYSRQMAVPETLHALIQAGKIPPTIGVFIDNLGLKTRAEELPCNPKFAQFMAHELVPWLAEKYAIESTADTRLLSGSSYGGLASACIAYQYPDLFGLVLSQSGSFWWGPSREEFRWLNTQFRQQINKQIRFYLSAGLFETSNNGRNILSTNRELYQILKNNGYPVTLETFTAGHDSYHWALTIERGLINLLGKP